MAVVIVVASSCGDCGGGFNDGSFFYFLSSHPTAE